MTGMDRLVLAGTIVLTLPLAVLQLGLPITVLMLLSTVVRCHLPIVEGMDGIVPAGTIVLTVLFAVLQFRLSIVKTTEGAAPGETLVMTLLLIILQFRLPVVDAVVPTSIAVLHFRLAFHSRHQNNGYADFGSMERVTGFRMRKIGGRNHAVLLFTKPLLASRVWRHSSTAVTTVFVFTNFTGMAKRS
jgi:hypothetical protein